VWNLGSIADRMDASKGGSAVAADQTKRDGAFKYDAFMSYSHAADARFAPFLQSTVQRFARPWYRIRSVRIFRDSTGLKLTPELWPDITRALDASRWFILLASSEAANSAWVDQEVRYWLTLRRSLPLIVVTSGRVAWNRDAADFDWSQTTALPSALKGCFKEEPLYLDATGLKADDLAPNHSKIRYAAAAIYAQLANRDIDDVIGDDVRQYRINRMSAVLAVLLLTVALGTALWQWRRTEMQRRAAEAQAAGLSALIQHEAGRSMEGLLDGLRGGKILEELVGRATDIQDYPATTPLLALQTIIDNIYEKSRSRQGLEQATTTVTDVERQRSCALRLDQGTTMALSDVPELQLRALMGHDGSVLASGCAPNGEYIVTAGRDGTVRLRSAAIPSAAKLVGLHGGVQRIIFDADSEGFTTNNPFETVVWRLPTHMIARHMVVLGGGASEVSSTAFSPAGGHVAVGYKDGTIRVWTSSGSPVDQPWQRADGDASSNFNQSVVGLHFAQENLLAVRASGTMDLLPLSGAPVRHVKLSDGMVMAVAFSPNSQFVAVALAGGAVALTESATGRTLPIKTGHLGWVHGLDFSSDGNRIVTGGADGTIRMFDLASGRSIGAPISSGQGQVTAVSFSPSGDRVMSVGSDGTGRLWDLAGQQLAQFIAQGRFLAVSFNKAGTLVATSGIEGTVRLWLPSGIPIATIAARRGALVAEVSGADFGAPSLSFSPDGERLLVPQDGGRAAIWRLQRLDELIAQGCDWLREAAHPSRATLCR
jgi:WD40 repeat protein